MKVEDFDVNKAITDIDYVADRIHGLKEALETAYSIGVVTGDIDKMKRELDSLGIFCENSNYWARLKNARGFLVRNKQKLQN